MVGSGLSALVFTALSSQSGAKILVLEAHEFAGGYGHTFQMGKSAKFNAQLHYVWNCGEGETVNQVLKKLSLDKLVTFEKLDPDGFDHMIIPGHSLKIPSDNRQLVDRIAAMFPDQRESVEKFLRRVENVASGLDLIGSPLSLGSLCRQGIHTLKVAKYKNSTLQNVFDEFKLDQRVQALLASQWPDFLLPPNRLSFFAWVMLFTGYQRGAYYPTHHFEQVIDSLVDKIEKAGSTVLLNHEVTSFIEKNGVIKGVNGIEIPDGNAFEFTAKQIICNMDPQRAASMIGIDKFAKKHRQRLNYSYSPSNFMIYCTLRDIDLVELGFGRWNTFHSGDNDLNTAFDRMYDQHDYSNPSFAITTPGLMTHDNSDRREDEQIVELLTVADYRYFELLKQKGRSEYLARKKEIMNQIFDVVEAHYIPDFRKHLRFKVAGTPTTNERFCWSPQGHSYGSDMTPENIGLNRLDYESSINGLLFCNASSGFAGFSGAFWTGKRLYEQQTRDRLS